VSPFRLIESYQDAEEWSSENQVRPV